MSDSLVLVTVQYSKYCTVVCRPGPILLGRTGPAIAHLEIEHVRPQLRTHFLALKENWAVERDTCYLA